MPCLFPNFVDCLSAVTSSTKKRVNKEDNVQYHGAGNDLEPTDQKDHRLEALKVNRKWDLQGEKVSGGGTCTYMLFGEGSL